MNAVKSLTINALGFESFSNDWHVWIGWNSTASNCH